MNLALYPSRVRSNEVLGGIWRDRTSAMAAVNAHTRLRRAQVASTPLARWAERLLPTAVHMHDGYFAIAQAEMKSVMEVANCVCGPISRNKCLNGGFVLRRGIGKSWQYTPAVEAMRALSWPIIADATRLWACLRKRHDAT